VPRVISLRVMWPWCRADHSHSCSVKAKNEWNYLLSLLLFHSVMFKLCTWAILSLPDTLNITVV
jgi:hypothetical protein